MVSAKTPFVIVGIVIALIIAIMLFTRFSLPSLGKIGGQVSDAFSDAGKGLQDFFNSFEENQNEANAESIRKGDPNDPFFRDIEPPRGSPQEAIERLDPTSPTFEQDKKRALEDLGITGADEINVLPNGGLQIIQRDRPDPKNIFGITPVFSDADLENFNLPNPFQGQQAFAEEFPQQITVIDARLPETRPLSLTDFVKSKPATKSQGSTTIQGIVQSEIPDKEFQVFSSDSSKSVKGVIRETVKDPRQVKVDSKKNPLETASERASRVFEETGSFADEGRGFKISTAQQKAKDFNFGTNTGSGLKIPTTNKGGESISNSSEKQRLEELKRIENEKALAVFNSRSISNF